MAMPFIALPYVLKTIGASNYGLAVFAQTIISYFSIFINFGPERSQDAQRDRLFRIADQIRPVLPCVRRAAPGNRGHSFHARIQNIVSGRFPDLPLRGTFPHLVLSGD